MFIKLFLLITLYCFICVFYLIDGKNGYFILTGLDFVLLDFSIEKNTKLCIYFLFFYFYKWLLIIQICNKGEYHLHHRVHYQEAPMFNVKFYCLYKNTQIGCNSCKVHQWLFNISIKLHINKRHHNINNNINKHP